MQSAPDQSAGNAILGDPAAEAAAILIGRRRSGEQGPRLPPSCRPADIDAALRIQSAVSARIGDHIGAWKCGMPAAGILPAAPIYGATVHACSPCTLWPQDGCARIEPELAFILAHDLPARAQAYTPVEVDAAIARTHLALELIGSRCRDAATFGFAENLADGLFNQGLFIGPEVDGEQARHAGELAISIAARNGPTRQFDGRHPNGDPRAALYWLAEHLRSQGQGLCAGQAVITGSYAGAIDVPLDEDISFRYGDLGAFVVRFTGK